MFGSFGFTKTKVSSYSNYKPNENENFVLENGLRYSVPLHKMPREGVFSVFEILVGQLKHQKPLSQEKLDRCNAKLCNLSHSFYNIKASNTNFRKFK